MARMDWKRLPALALARPTHVGAGMLATGLAVPLAGRALVCGLLVVIACALAATWDGDPATVRVVAIGLLALVVGAELGERRLTALDAPLGRVLDGERVVARAHLLGHPRRSPLGTSVAVRLTSGPLRDLGLLARLPPWEDDIDALGASRLGEHAREPRAGLVIGAEVSLRGRVRSLARIAREDREREFQVAAWLRRRGLAGELLLDAAAPTGRRRGGLTGMLDRLRTRGERAVGAGLRDDRAALLRGMVLGQDEAISQPVRDEFRAAGLSHILAVSGQNVMLLVVLALPALIAAGLGSTGRALALLALIALYVPLAGAGLSLQRAAIMGAAGIAATLAARPASRSYALLLAAVVTLALNPRACTDPGWQLSFAAVAGILILGRPLSRSLRRGIAAMALGDDGLRPLADPVARRELAPPSGDATARRLAALAARALPLLADGVAITMAATLATAPLLAYHFGVVSLASLPANVLAMPAVALAMWIGMLKLALGQLASVGVPQEPITALLGALATPPLAFLATVAERFAAFPAAQLRLNLDTPTAVAAAYVALAMAVLTARRITPPLLARAGEAGARWRGLAPTSRAMAIAIAVVVGFLLAAESLAPPRPPEALTVRFLDVGQGDATLIQHPDGTAVLFDGGPPEADVARLLRRAGVRRLALVVATHMSRDHHGGLRSVLRSFPVGTLLDGGDGTRDPDFRALRTEAERQGIRRLPGLAPLSLRVGALTIRVLSPPPRPTGPPPEDPNPRAIAAVVSADGFDMLLTGDAESPAIAPLPLARVDALKIPHHGSADPGLPQLLERLAPAVAAIEVGRHNLYGHPAPSTLSALRRAGVRAYRTDRDGTITLTAAGDELRIATER